MQTPVERIKELHQLLELQWLLSVLFYTNMDNPVAQCSLIGCEYKKDKEFF